MAGLTGVTVLDEQVMNRIGFTVSEVNDPVYGDRLHAGIKAPEWIYTRTLGPELTKLPRIQGLSYLWRFWIWLMSITGMLLRYAVSEHIKGEQTIDSKYRLVQICRSEELDADLTGRLRQDGKAVLVLALPVEYRLYREIFRRIQEAGLTNPAIIRLSPGRRKNESVLWRLHNWAVFSRPSCRWSLDRNTGNRGPDFPFGIEPEYFTVCRSASV